MLSGHDPGELGLYGFRNRVPGSYQLQLVHSHDLQRPLLWERLRPEQRACVLFVPPSYPPRPLRGGRVPVEELGVRERFGEDVRPVHRVFPWGCRPAARRVRKGWGRGEGAQPASPVSWYVYMSLM